MCRWLVLSGLAIALYCVGCAAPPPPPAKLTTPTPGKTATGVVTPSSTYVVQQGDTLYGIAQRHGVSVKEIMRANPEVHPLNLPVGAHLKLPEHKIAPSTPAGVVATSTPYAAGPVPPRSRTGYIWPLRGDLLLRYGEPMPGGGARSQHIEISATAGAQVLAARAGHAYRAERVPGLGKVIIIVHDDGAVTLYGHNSTLLAEHGASVAQGDVVALAGDSGRAVSPRLAFMLLRGGTAIDPLEYLP